MRRRPQIIVHILGLISLLFMLWIWVGNRHILTEANYAMGDIHACLGWGGGKVFIQVNDCRHFPGYNPLIVSGTGSFVKSWGIDPQRINILSVPPIRIEKGPPSTVFLITIAQWLILLAYLSVWPIGYLLWQRRKRHPLPAVADG